MRRLQAKMLCPKKEHSNWGFIDQQAIKSHCTGSKIKLITVFLAILSGKFLNRGYGPKCTTEPTVYWAELADKHPWERVVDLFQKVFSEVRFFFSELRLWIISSHTPHFSHLRVVPYKCWDHWSYQFRNRIYNLYKGKLSCAV